MAPELAWPRGRELGGPRGQWGAAGESLPAPGKRCQVLCSRDHGATVTLASWVRGLPEEPLPWASADPELHTLPRPPLLTRWVWAVAPAPDPTQGDTDTGTRAQRPSVWCAGPGGHWGGALGREGALGCTCRATSRRRPRAGVCSAASSSPGQRGHRSRGTVSSGGGHSSAEHVPSPRPSAALRGTFPGKQSLASMEHTCPPGPRRPGGGWQVPGQAGQSAGHCLKVSTEEGWAGASGRARFSPQTKDHPSQEDRP